MLLLVPPRRHSAMLSPGEAADLPLLRSHFSAIHRTPSLGVKQGACPPSSLLNGGKRKKQTLTLRVEASTCQAERGAAEVKAAACRKALPAAGAGPAACWLLGHMLLGAPELHQAARGAARRRAARPRERRPAWKSGRGRRDEPEGKRLQLL